jgi:hypothetical protein
VPLRKSYLDDEGRPLCYTVTYSYWIKLLLSISLMCFEQPVKLKDFQLIFKIRFHFSPFSFLLSNSLLKSRHFNSKWIYHVRYDIHYLPWRHSPSAVIDFLTKKTKMKESLYSVHTSLMLAAVRLPAYIIIPIVISILKQGETFICCLSLFQFFVYITMLFTVEWLIQGYKCERKYLPPSKKNTSHKHHKTMDIC